MTFSCGCSRECGIAHIAMPHSSKVDKTTLTTTSKASRGIIHMMTSSNGNIFRVTGPFCGKFTGPGELPAQRPVTRSFDVFFDLRPNKRLSKQPWGWWFEMPSWSLWRHSNACKNQHCGYGWPCVPYWIHMGCYNDKCQQLHTAEHYTICKQ